MARRYYVYLYLRLDGSPYYVGKGKGSRAYRRYNRYAATPSDIERIRLVSEGMSERDALQAEMLLIRLYGRKDLGTGILRNLTDGGEGISGLIYSEERRLSLSKKLKGRVFSEAHRRNLSAGKKGFIVTEKHRSQISAAMKGRVFTEETRNLISKAKLGVASLATRGSKNPRAKITLDDVILIRSGDMNEKQAFASLTLSRSQFYRIKRGEQWI